MRFEVIVAIVLANQAVIMAHLDCIHRTFDEDIASDKQVATATPAVPALVDNTDV